MGEAIPLCNTVAQKGLEALGKAFRPCGHSPTVLCHHRPMKLSSCLRLGTDLSPTLVHSLGWVPGLVFGPIRLLIRGQARGLAPGKARDQAGH